MWSAEKLVMVGVGALGVYAVYRLITAPKDQTSTQTVLPATPKASDARIPPILPPPAALPVQAGSPGAPPPGFPTAPSGGGTVHLTNSRAYRGRLETRAGSSLEEAQARIRQMGFETDSIQIFPTPEVAAPVVPSFALENAGQGTRWFHARWTNPTADVTRPPELVLLWTVASAPPRALASSPLTAGWRYPHSTYTGCAKCQT